LRSAGSGERRHGAESCASGGSLLAGAVVFATGLNLFRGRIGGQKEQPHRFGRSKPKDKPARCGVDRLGRVMDLTLPCACKWGPAIKRPCNQDATKRAKSDDDGRPDHSSWGPT
jgi:hypothetical protein